MWAQVFTIYSSHRYCLPNHWIFYFTVFFSTLGVLFLFSKTKFPALRSLSVLFLETKCSSWQCLSLVEPSHNKHSQDQVHELLCHFNVRKNHLSETRHHVEKYFQVGKNLFLTDCSWSRFLCTLNIIEWVWYIEIDYTVQPTVKIIANTTLGHVFKQPLLQPL